MSYVAPELRPAPMGELRFWIPGPAVPKGRPRTFQRREGGVTRTRTITPDRTREYEAWVKLQAQRALVELRRAGNGMLFDPDAHFRVSLDLHDGGTWVTVQWWTAARGNRVSDLDNVAKSILDGCEGVLWKNDRQVMDLRVCDMLSPKPEKPAKLPRARAGQR